LKSVDDFILEFLPNIDSISSSSDNSNVDSKSNKKKKYNLTNESSILDKNVLKEMNPGINMTEDNNDFEISV
jgi:hypothetical protein